jgi:hypothetical protein
MEDGADIEGYGLEGYLKKSFARLDRLRSGDNISRDAGDAEEVGAESD